MVVITGTGLTDLSGEQGIEGILDLIRKHFGQRVNVAFVAFASDVTPEEDYYVLRESLVRLREVASTVCTLHVSDDTAYILSKLQEADVVYVAGGNPTHLA